MLKLTPNITSQKQYALEKAFSSPFFDPELYSKFSHGEQTSMLGVILEGKEKGLPKDFNKSLYYSLREPEMRYNYYATSLMRDSIEDLEYEEFLKGVEQQSKIDSALNEYEISSGVEKALGTIGNFLEGIGVEFVTGVQGTIRSIYDIFTLYKFERGAIGDFIYGAGDQMKNDWFDKYEMRNIKHNYLSKHQWGQIVEGTAKTIVNLLPLIFSGGIGGKILFYGLSYGKTYEDTFYKYPDISRERLILNAAGTTAISAATRRLFSDVVFGEGLIDISKMPIISDYFIARVLGQTVTEGIESGMAAVASNLLSAQILQDPTIKDQLGKTFINAAIIGGLMGAITTTFKIGTTKKREGLSRLKSFDLNVLESKVAQLALRDYVDELSEKYGNVTIEELVSRHPLEFQHAQEQNYENQLKFKELAESLVSFYNSIGHEEFIKAVEVLDVSENWQKNVAKNRFVDIITEDKYSKLDREGHSLLVKNNLNETHQIVEDYTPKALKMREHFATEFGMNLVFFNSIDPAHAIDSKMMFVSENTLLLNSDYVSNRTITNIESNLIKHKLIERLQIRPHTRGGYVFDHNLLNVIDEAIKGIDRPEETLTNMVNFIAGEGEPVGKMGKTVLDTTGTETRVLEQQKVAVGMLLDDGNIIDHIFKARPTKFESIVKYFKNMRKNTKLDTHEGKLTYLELTGVIGLYKEVALSTGYTNIDQYTTMLNLFDIDGIERQQLLKDFKEADFKDRYIYSRADKTYMDVNEINAVGDLMEYYRGDRYTFYKGPRESDFHPEFANKIKQDYQEPNFDRAFSKYTMDKYGIVFSLVGEGAIAPLSIFQHLKIDVLKSLFEINNNEVLKERTKLLNELIQKHGTLDNWFVDGLFDESVLLQLKRVVFDKVVTISGSKSLGDYNIRDGNIEIIETGRIEKTSKMPHILNSLIHEIGHAFQQTTGLSLGSSPAIFSRWLNNNPKKINELYKITGATGVTELSIILYSATYGEILSRSQLDYQDIINEDVLTFQLEQDGSLSLIGHGKFKDIVFDEYGRYNESTVGQIIKGVDMSSNQSRIDKYREISNLIEKPKHKKMLSIQWLEQALEILIPKKDFFNRYKELVKNNIKVDEGLFVKATKMIETDFNEINLNEFLNIYKELFKVYDKNSNKITKVLELKSEVITDTIKSFNQVEYNRTKQNIIDNNELSHNTNMEKLNKFLDAGHLNDKQRNILHTILAMKTPFESETQVQDIEHGRITTGSHPYKHFVRSLSELFKTATDSDVLAVLETLNTPEAGHLGFTGVMKGTTALVWAFEHKEMFSTETQKEIETMYQYTMRSAGMTLSMASQVVKAADPLHGLKKDWKATFKKDLPVPKEFLDKYQKAIDENDYKSIMKLQRELVNSLKDSYKDSKIQFKGGSYLEKRQAILDFMDKSDSFRHLAMLFNPATMFRQRVANYGIKALDKMSNLVLHGVEKVLGKFYDGGQMKFTSVEKVDDSVKKYVNDKLVDNGLLEMMLDGTGKYERSLTKDSLFRKIEKEFRFKTGFLNKFSNMIRKNYQIRDQKFIIPKVAEYLGQMIQATYGSDTSKISQPAFNMMMNTAITRAERVYLSAEPTITRGIYEWGSKIPGGKVWLKGLIPFARIQENITKAILDYSPVGLAKGLYQFINSSMTIKDTSPDVKIKFEKMGIVHPYLQAKGAENIAKGITGTVLMGLGIALAQMGIVGLDKEDKYAGAVLRIGEYKIRLSKLTPYASPIVLGATLASDSKEFPNVGKRLMSFVSDQTLLGIVDSNLGYHAGLDDFIRQPFLNYTTQFIPAIVRVTARLIDPHATKYSSNPYKRSIQQWFNAIPFVSKDMPKRINPYTGEKELVAEAGHLFRWFNVLTPFHIDKINDLNLYNEAYRLDSLTTGPNGTFTINTQSYKLKDKELEKYQSDRGRYVNSMMTSLLKSKNYNNLTDEEKSKEIKKIYEKATLYSKIRYWTNNNNKYYFTNREDFVNFRKVTQHNKGVSFNDKIKGSRFK